MRRIRDYVQPPVANTYFAERLSAGWKLKAIEWESDEDDGTESEGKSDKASGAPFGFQISADGSRLEPNRRETAVLLLVLEMTVLEKGVSRIADELNLRGYKTRDGSPWTATAVFNLLPTLIELGPDLLKSAEWAQRRPSLQVKNS